MNSDVVILASLLHDIGKLIYRALPPEYRHANRHQELGFKWARHKNLPNEVQEVIRRHHFIPPKDPKYYDLAAEAYNGSFSVKNLIYLVAEADNIASGMERRGLIESGSFEIDHAMGVVFDKIALDRAPSQIHSWEPLLLEDTPYPIENERLPKQKVANFYKNVWIMLRKALSNPDNFQEDRLLLVLEKYLSQMPEYTYASPGSWPDTSLYYHLKSTAALSLCNYLFLVDKYNWDEIDLKDEIYKRNQRRYILVGADLSGIQDFIYTTSSKAVLKTVRARSFYLDLMIESAATQLCELLNLGRSNLIYASGGGFYLLAPNTKVSQDGLNKFLKEFNGWLYENFGTSLYLCIAAEELNGTDLMGEESRLQRAWSSLHEKLRLQKNKKWEPFLLEDSINFFSPRSTASECQICHQCKDVNPVNLGETTLNLCEFCCNMTKLGQQLPHLDVFYETKQPLDLHSSAALSLTVFNRYYHFSDKPPKDVSAAYHMSYPWDIPANDYPIRPFPSGSYYTESDLSKLASMSIGDKKIGVLRMDVDHLGKIFSKGLQNATFARMSDLSARLNQYFKYYLPRLLSNSVSYSFLPLEPRGILVNVIYAGGDDLFLVGTWDAVIETANIINSDFRKFTCLNQDITISGGIVIADEKMAIYKLADIAAEAEAKAKHSGRNSLCLMGISFSWDEVEELRQYLHIFTPQIKQDGLAVSPIGFSKSFLQRFGALVGEYCRLSAQEEKMDDFSGTTCSNSRVWVYPNLYYLFARARSAAKDGNSIKFYNKLLALCASDNDLTRRLPVVLGILKLMLRRVTESAD